MLDRSKHRYWIKFKDHIICKGKLKILKHTLDSHAVAEIQGVPYHRSVGDGDQGLGEFIWVWREGGEGDTWTTQDDGLNPLLRHGELGLRSRCLWWLLSPSMRFQVLLVVYFCNLSTLEIWVKLSSRSEKFVVVLSHYQKINPTRRQFDATKKIAPKEIVTCQPVELKLALPNIIPIFFLKR